MEIIEGCYHKMKLLSIRLLEGATNDETKDERDRKKWIWKQSWFSEG